ncbi:hypothetical protein IEN85_05420 [Pelagicoccus sp. NFK12]|uniref:Tetratricopeptide repeat protein n=1 Tax=Pelagicoccus enzymogenes TaxID=2773457 RepID=A0A927F8L4_9BACT|nr:hypothetical protein [Pelagicoccus enzymogenes]MBD5778923.1 hypothetical protein [Pelagicoccus enzymogenes]MDQ8197333.1 hypothetical protein [Pelagicoccus enzymogenes]
MKVPAILIASALLALLPQTLLAKKKDRAEIPATNLAVYLLKQLNEREQEAYDRYESAVAAEDVDQVRRELQSIIDGYEKLISDSPNYAPAYTSFGLMLSRTGNRDEANAMFLKSDQLDPMQPVVKNQLGNYMAEEGKYTEAYGFYMLARDLAPEEPLYHLQLGNLLVAYRKYFLADGLFAPTEIDDQIIGHFRSATRRAPKDISYKMRYAQAFFDIENPNWETALGVWQELYKAAGSEYEQQVVRLYTARVRYELGHHTAARKLISQLDHPSLDESKQTLLDEINAKYPQ